MKGLVMKGLVMDLVMVRLLYLYLTGSTKILKYI